MTSKRKIVAVISGIGAGFFLLMLIVAIFADNEQGLVIENCTFENDLDPCSESPLIKTTWPWTDSNDIVFEPAPFGEEIDVDDPCSFTIEAQPLVWYANDPNLGVDLDANRHLPIASVDIGHEPNYLIGAKAWADIVDIIPFDANQLLDLKIFAVDGENCTVKSKDGILHFTGDINVFINVVYDSIMQSPIGMHTKPVVFRDAWIYQAEKGFLYREDPNLGVDLDADSALLIETSIDMKTVYSCDADPTFLAQPDVNSKEAYD